MPFSVVATDSAGRTALSSFAVSVYSACDLEDGGGTTAADLQTMINEALGTASPANDLNHDGVVNVVDVEISTNAVLGLGCSAS